MRLLFQPAGARLRASSDSRDTRKWHVFVTPHMVCIKMRQELLSEQFRQYYYPVASSVMDAPCIHAL